MQEIPLRLLVKTLTGKRIFNAVRAVSSYLYSAVTRKKIAWGYPLILSVEPTNICNLKCPLCVTGNGSLTRPRGTMDFATFQKIIDAFGDYLFYLVLYQQGEPFLNKDLIRFIEYAKSRRIFITTSTNGHYFTPETARKTVASGLDSLIVSIDGADQESYEKYRVAGNLSKTLDGIRHLVRQKKNQQQKTPVIFVQFIAMRHNESQIADMRKMTKKIGADKLLIKTVHVETVQQARQWLPARRRLQRYVIRDNRLLPKRHGLGTCHRPWTSALFNWDGSVAPCCFDKNAAHNLGSLKNQKDLHKIWNSSAYDTFRTHMLTKRDTLEICANCSQGLRLFV